MRRAKEIRSDLLVALESSADAPLASLGFRRNRRAIHYSRAVGEAKQKIDFAADYLPRYWPGEELCFNPLMQVQMKSVSEEALHLVEGDATLLANAPDIMVIQPIEITAPKPVRRRWVASGLETIEDRVSDICQFVREWVTPLLDEIRMPGDWIAMYERRDERLVKQRHWYLYVAAAYRMRGDDRGALAVLESELGQLGPRRRYAAAFKALTTR